MAVGFEILTNISVFVEKICSIGFNRTLYNRIDGWGGRYPQRRM